MQMFCINLWKLFGIELIHEINLLCKMQIIPERERQDFDTGVSEVVEKKGRKEDRKDGET